MKLYAVVKVYEAKSQIKIEVPFCSDEVATVQEKRDRLLAVSALGTIITTVEVDSYKLSKTGMLEVTDAYNYECVRTSVLYNLQSRYPGLDETRPEVQELIDDLADHAYEGIGRGADEDWSVDDAFRYFKEDVANICAEE